MSAVCARTWIAPFGIVSAEQIENALAPPPDGSTCVATMELRESSERNVRDSSGS
jgi:hypothetical protein